MQDRADLIPAEPGWEVHILESRTAREAGAPEISVYPVVAWLAHWDASAGDPGCPISLSPVYIHPAEEGEWNSDYGAGVSVIDLNYGRAEDDLFKWKVVRSGR